MKIGFFGLNCPEGKIKFYDERLEILAEKFTPDKVTPYFVEFLKEETVRAESFAVLKTKILDLLIYDIEKTETRITNSSDEAEISALKKALALLEQEIPLCNGNFTETENKYLKNLALLSLKPVALIDEKPTETSDETYINFIIKSLLEKSGIVFFYTAGKKEVRAWPIAKNSSIVDCAAKIHTDLARGFIKADIITLEDLLKAHNLNDARQKNLVKVVGKEYTIRDGDIIEIRFNVST